MAQRIRIAVKPRSKKASLICLPDGSYQASLTAPAHNGQANRALIELLVDHFSVRKSQIKIVRGARARIKFIEIG
jgi:uncharacterized protein (TIGR00251 family)